MQILENDICVCDIQQSDAESYFEIFSHPDVARFDDFEPIDRAQLAIDMSRISKYTHDSLTREFAVVLLSERKMIGVLAIEMKRKYCYLGYHFNPQYHGSGYAQSAVLMFINECKPELKDIFRLVADPANIQSIKLAQKVGFKYVFSRKVKEKRELVFEFVNHPKPNCIEESLLAIAQNQ